MAHKKRVQARQSGHTEVATLRMELVSPIRIVRRVIEISTATSLAATAKTIRAAWNWWDTKRDFAFETTETTWTSGQARGAKGRRNARAARLADVIKAAGGSFEFVHNLTEDRRRTVVVASVTECDEPETAFPRLTEAAGCIALDELTPDDASYDYIAEAADPTSHRQAHCIEMCENEAKRAEQDLRFAKTGVEQVRLSRRGPLRSHQPGSRREGPAAPGLEPEPETEPKRFDMGPQTKRIKLQVRENHPKPRVRVQDGVAHFEDIEMWALLRQHANEWRPPYDEPAKAAVDALRPLASAAPTDPTILSLYGHALKEAGQWTGALDVYGHAIQIGRETLPADFSGRLDDHSESAHGLADCARGAGFIQCHTGARKRGTELLELAIQWDPQPDNPARRTVYSEHLRGGNIAAARRGMETRAPFHAPYDYDLALCGILEQDLEDAITNIRRGLVSNPYIAEMLLGNRTPPPVPMGTDGGGRCIEDAGHYTLSYGNLWKRTPGALALLRWVATHPAAIAAAALAREADYAAAYEHDPDKRHRLIECFLKAIAATDASVSRAMLEQHAAEQETPWTRTEHRREPSPLWDY